MADQCARRYLQEEQLRREMKQGQQAFAVAVEHDRSQKTGGGAAAKASQGDGILQQVRRELAVTMQAADDFNAACGRALDKAMVPSGCSRNRQQQQGEAEASHQHERHRPSSSMAGQVAALEARDAQRQRLAELKQEISEGEDALGGASTTSNSGAEDQMRQSDQGWRRLEQRLVALQQGMPGTTPSGTENKPPPAGRRRSYLEVAEGAKSMEESGADRGEGKFPRLQLAKETREAHVVDKAQPVIGIAAAETVQRRDGWACRGPASCGFKWNSYRSHFCEVCHRGWRRSARRQAEDGGFERRWHQSCEASSTHCSSSEDEISSVDEGAAPPSVTSGLREVHWMELASNAKAKGKGYGGRSCAVANDGEAQPARGSVGLCNVMLPAKALRAVENGRPRSQALLRSAVESSADALGSTHQVTQVLRGKLDDVLAARPLAVQIAEARSQAIDLLTQQRGVQSEMESVTALIRRQQLRRVELIEQELSLQAKQSEAEATISTLQEARDKQGAEYKRIHGAEDYVPGGGAHGTLGNREKQGTAATDSQSSGSRGSGDSRRSATVRSALQVGEACHRGGRAVCFAPSQQTDVSSTYEKWLEGF